MAHPADLDIGTLVCVTAYPFDDSQHNEEDYRMKGAVGRIVELPSEKDASNPDLGGGLWGIRVLTTCGKTVKDFCFADEMEALNELEALALETPDAQS